ncbi:MAG TPA: DNA-binding response regulator [Bacteroidales bacterium]|nr:MAG: DNA-binding response regulator [Bacteroidetes bacterium GWE2_42_24]OFY27792.1 MAG: DNA-binding response regulator [Bacteroidetes bacterium GWF2_43_11]HAQ64882.1 DNA-binding response regulator [Bacteroidales bacterium]HBZ66152.1 DNA-binding response regulator [Bacteroidales bacterium]
MENHQYKILLVDDEPDVLEFLSYNLKKEGFTVLTCSDGQKAVEIARKEKPSLIILDVMMPGMDGIETCAEIKRTPYLSDAIIIFLTARGEDYSQIAGFDAGADDYVTKPIKPKVLISRVKALLRRLPVSKNDQLISVDEFTIDRERYLVIKDGQEIVLPKKEFELLMLLAGRPNKVFTRDEIFSAVWGDDVIVGDRTIDVHVRKIREKLNTPGIKTIKGVGYKYETKN